MQRLKDHCGSQVVFAAGKLDFSIPGAQTSDQHQRHNLNKSKHGLPCFVVFVSCSAKFSFDMLRIMGLICILPSVLTSQQSLSNVIEDGT